jgi:type IV pilus assembly protein PilQ|tara:strand:+ start:6283 stop:7839 length:1557 start_codon:yes stop_codon:yes gene_type:complete
MKTYNNIFSIAFLTIFLSACASTVLNSDTSNLIESENFIAERKEIIAQTVALGPQIIVDSNLEQKVSKNERRELNREEIINYMDVSNDQNEIFPITINFENISIQDMAVMFSEITDRNILIGDEVQGKVTAKLIDVPWDKALDSILKIKKLAKYVDEEANIIRIHNQDVLVAQEEFDLQRIEDLKKARSAQRGIEPIYTEIFRLYYTEASEVSGEILSVMNSGAEESESGGAKTVQITIDKRLNSLIIKATKPELDLISKLITEVDVRTKQILIEAFIVEATDTFGKELGAKFGLDAPNLQKVFGAGGDKYNIATAGTVGTQADGALALGDTAGLIANNAVSGALGGIGFILGTTSSNLKFELSASEKDGVTKVISNPRVFTLDGEEAVIIQGEEIPYKTEAEGGGTDIQFKEAGVKLTVTPTIVGDGNIILSVKVEKKTAKNDEANPPITTREITTKLLIRDDTIVVIGGVFTQETTDSENKVPFFSDLPFVGKLFRYEKAADVRKELLVFLAPRII